MKMWGRTEKWQKIVSIWIQNKFSSHHAQIVKVMEPKGIEAQQKSKGFETKQHFSFKKLRTTIFFNLEMIFCDQEINHYENLY